MEHLEDVLKDNGFVLKQRDPKEIYEKIVETGKDKYTSQFVLFIDKFIGLYKTAGYRNEGFDALRKKTENVRTLLFLDIVEKIYSEYMDELQRQNRIDFEDMINEAIAYLDEIQAGEMDLPYRYIIIDEFQDIAKQRFMLVNKLSKITDAKIIAVGDDWQSIFAFAGSELSLFTDFVENMGHGTEMRLNNTYRNSQELIDIAGRFIQKNSKQKKKRLVSDKHISEPVAIRPYDDGEKYTRGKVVDQIIGEIKSEFGERSKILLLGRYGFDGDNLARSDYFWMDHKGKIFSKNHPEMNLTFMTAHGSKGLGYDNVVILNMTEGRYGFPCQIEDDPIMKLVVAEDNNIRFAEERRLFYVSLTRTKNRVYIAAPIRRPSRFLVELIEDSDMPHPDNMNMEIIDPIEIRCPRCAHPLKYERNKTYGLPLYMCTNEPELCGFMTNNRAHKHDIFKCPDCEDGYMVVRMKGARPLYGCTNYLKNEPRRCKKTVPIYTTNVFDFGDYSGKNLLMEVINGKGERIFIKKYLDPLEARKDYDQIGAFDRVEKWKYADFEFSREKFEKMIIATNELKIKQNFTHLGRAMFPEVK
jgi:DNA helicase-4